MEVENGPVITQREVVATSEPTGLTIDSFREGLGDNVNAELVPKLVLHRGWHQLTSAQDRPLENTRQAYLDSIKLNAAYGECDVWDTKDGQMVLCHDSNFKSMASDPSASLASSPIKDLTWGELAGIPLLD